MPQLILRVAGEANIVGVLEDDGFTFSAPPQDCIYEIFNNYKLSSKDPDLQFLKVTSSFGYLVYRIVNPYGADLELASDGRIQQRQVVNLTFNSDKTLITDVKIDAGGNKIARKLQLIFDSNPSAPQIKFHGGELSADVERIVEYVQYWFNTQAMLYYIAEFNNAIMHSMLVAPRNFNGFMSFVEQEVRREQHIKHAADRHEESKPRQEKDHIISRAAEFWSNLRASQEPVPVTRTPATSAPAITTPASGVLQFSRSTTATTSRISEVEARFEIELAKSTVLSLTDKYKIISSEEKVKEILDEIIDIYRKMPALRKTSLSGILRQLFDTCPILELMLCLQALVYLQEDSSADMESIKGQLKTAIVELILNYKAEALRDEVLQFLNDNHIDDILFKYCPVRLQSKCVDLCNAIGEMLAKPATPEPDATLAPTAESLSATPLPLKVKTVKTKPRKTHAAPAASKTVTFELDLDDFLDTDDADAGVTVAITSFDQAAQLLKSKPFSVAERAAVIKLFASNPEIIQENHFGQPSLLMLGLANREVPISVLEVLIAGSEHAIARLDQDRRGVMHYWVTHRNPNKEESFKIFQLLFAKYITYLQKTTFAKYLVSHGQLNFVPIIEYFRDKTGDTFLHLLIPKVKDPYLLKSYFTEIIPPLEVDVSLQAASALLIAKNACGNNAICIFKDKEYSISPATQSSSILKSQYEAAEVNLKVFYNRMAVRLFDATIIINPAAYGPDFLNVFNFQPKDPNDRFVREFKKANEAGITFVYRIIKDQMELRGVMRRGNIHGARFIDLLGNKELSDMFFSDTHILTVLCIQMYQDDPKPSKPKINSLLAGWLASKEIFTTPVECLTRYVRTYAIEKPCPDQVEIEACLNVISLLVAQLRKLPRAKWSQFNDKKIWDWASFFLYSTFSFLGDMPNLRIDLKRYLPDLQFFVECYSLATNQEDCEKMLRRAFKLLNGKERISDFDRVLIPALRTGLTARVPHEKAVNEFLQECSCHHEGPIDWIADPNKRLEVRRYFDPFARATSDCARAVM